MSRRNRAVAEAEPTRSPRPKAGEVITVACKLPNGIILRRFRPIHKTELVVGGGSRDVTEYVDTGERHAINGVGREPGKMPFTRNTDNGVPIDGSIATMLDTGFALTYNVPKDLWEDWLAANKDTMMVKNGLIFASSNVSSLKAQGKEMESQRSGLEAIDPERPGGNVQESDEQKARRRGQALHV